MDAGEGGQPLNELLIIILRDIFSYCRSPCSTREWERDSTDVSLRSKIRQLPSYYCLMQDNIVYSLWFSEIVNIFHRHCKCLKSS